MNGATNRGKSRDKRKYLRKSCRTPIGFATLDRHHTAIIRDISDGGVFLDTVAAISAGRDVAMKIQISDDQEPIMIIGEVVWNSPRGLGVKFKMGFDSSLIQCLMDDS